VNGGYKVMNLDLKMVYLEWLIKALNIEAEYEIQYGIYKRFNKLCDDIEADIKSFEQLPRLEGE
jgi:hypothetical protein